MLALMIAGKKDKCKRVKTLKEFRFKGLPDLELPAVQHHPLERVLLSRESGGKILRAINTRKGLTLEGE